MISDELRSYIEDIILGKNVYVGNFRKQDFREILESNDIDYRAYNDKRTLLMDCYMSLTSRDLLKLLLESGANVNAQDKDGWTPLMYAVNWGVLDTIKLLLQNGADVTLVDKEGDTVLKHAHLGGSDSSNKEEILELLEKAMEEQIQFKNFGKSIEELINEEEKEFARLLKM